MKFLQSLKKQRLSKRLSAPLLAALGAAVLVALLFLSYALSAGLLREHDISILLPEGMETVPVVSADSQLLTVQNAADIAIGKGNAKRVIASLTRPAAYSCKIENILHYNGQTTTLYCTQYVQNGVERVDTTDASGNVRNTLLYAGETVYAWNRGESRLYEGKKGNFNDDAAAMLPTYEDVLDETVTLAEAERHDIDYEPCIRAAFDRDGYRCVYYISIATGLLKSASFYQEGVVVRQVMVRDLRTGPPDEAVFTLPSGQSVLGN